MHSVMAGEGLADGVNWPVLGKTLLALQISPVIGFVFSALLLFLARRLLRNPALHRPPDEVKPPPPAIRALLVLTCTGVSFAHGSNDGQKGMGLIMLVLVGTVPTTYALNRAMPASEMPRFVAVAQVTEQSLLKMSHNAAPPADPRAVLSQYVRTQKLNDTVL